MSRTSQRGHVYDSLLGREGCTENSALNPGQDYSSDTRNFNQTRIINVRVFNEMLDTFTKIHQKICVLDNNMVSKIRDGLGVDNDYSSAFNT